MNKLILLINFILFLKFGYIYANGKICNITCGRRPGSHFKILSGDIVENESSWPWVYQLRFGMEDCNVQYCTDVLISKTFLLTSAHCLFHNYYDCSERHKNTKKHVLVEYDSDQIQVIKDGSTFNVKNFILPGGYNENLGGDKLFPQDIAIIEIYDQINEEPACLATFYNPFVAKMHAEVLVGYGLHLPQPNSNDHKLRVAQVKISKAGVGINGIRCRTEWGFHAKICAGNENRGGLEGDSGAAVYATIHTVEKNIYFIHGILSAYKSGTSSRHLKPDVYTPIEDWCDFIKFYTRNEATCIDAYKLENSPECNPYGF